MPRPQHRTISKRAVHALPADGSDALYWDRDLPGFGVRVYPSGRKSYVVQCRGPNGSQRVTIGQHGTITADEARKQAAPIIDRIKRGEDPVPAPAQPEPTVADLAERFMRAHVEVNCKPATAGFYSLALDKHILPALGAMAVRAVEPAHVSPLHYALRSKPVTANRVIDILSKMLPLAEAWNLRPAGSNPCRTVHRYKEKKRERFLSPDETRRLGEVLDQAEAEGGASVYAVAAIRLLMLTGCRLNEGRVGGWRADFRVRWLFRRFRSGPQSGSHGLVSSPPLIKPDMRISRIRLSDKIMPSRSKGPGSSA